MEGALGALMPLLEGEMRGQIPYLAPLLLLGVVAAVVMHQVERAETVALVEAVVLQPFKNPAVLEIPQALHHRKEIMVEQAPLRRMTAQVETAVAAVLLQQAEMVVVPFLAMAAQEPRQLFPAHL